MPPNVFHVVIERPRDVGAGAATRLADAVAARYGIPAEQLRDRLAAGRLRVKSNVDRSTAETFASELEELGAVSAILYAATDQPVPPPAKPKPAPVLASGLAAAFSGKAAEPQDLGALGSGEFTVSTLDGDDDDAPLETADDGPMLAATFGPPVAKEVPQPPRSAPVDLFAPPEDEKPPELAIDDLPKRGGTLAAERADGAARERGPAGSSYGVGTPPPARASTPPPFAAEDAPLEPAAAAPPSRGLADWIADRRVRLAAGVAIAILLGFVPASVIATMRESSAYAEIDRDIKKRFEAVYSEDDWNALDAMLARERTHKEDERRSIAMQSMLVWALAGGGIAYLWFRRIDWDRLADRFAS